MAVKQQKLFRPAPKPVRHPINNILQSRMCLVFSGVPVVCKFSFRSVFHESTMTTMLTQSS
jgi:hypothetical protein